MVRTGSVQDAIDLVNLTLGPLGVRRSGVFANGPEDGQQADGYNGLFVDDVKLVADGSNGKTSAGRQDGGLRHKAVSGYRVQDRLSLLLGVFGRDIGGVTDRGDLGCDSRKGAQRDDWSEAGSACGR